jgi:hypothetical protein
MKHLMELAAALVKSAGHRGTSNGPAARFAVETVARFAVETVAQLERLEQKIDDLEAKLIEKGVL